MASHTRFHGIGEREPWVYGEKAEEHRPQVAGLALSVDPVPARLRP